MDFLHNNNNNFINEIDYEAQIVQINGQRKYGGPPLGWNGDPPLRGTEIFISGLPRKMRENNFVPIFATVGCIYSTRLMMDFSGNNRGFAFIQYSKITEAKRAITELNDYEIKSGVKLSVSKSVDNCRLFVGHIPKTLNKEQIETLLKTYTDDIKEVFIYYNPANKKLNRGFCFVEYEDHRAACLARRKFFMNGIPELPDIVIDWAIPEEEVDEEVMNLVTVMYLRNLMLQTSESKLRDAIHNFVKPHEISRIRKVRDFAFVHFSNRNATANAIKHLNGYCLDDAIISATWAKPAFAIEGFNKNLIANKKQIKKKMQNKSTIINENQNVNYYSFDQRIDTSMTSTPVRQRNFKSDYQICDTALPSSINQITTNNDIQTHTNIDLPCDVQQVLNNILLCFSKFPAAVALQKLYTYFGWGEVEFKIWIHPGHEFGSLHYTATIDIHKGDRIVASYYDLCHITSPTAEDAKNLAAQKFLRYYFWNKFS